MLIVSGFSDYYDSSARWGVDKSVVFKRVYRASLLKLEHIKWINFNPYVVIFENAVIETNYIYFCGRFYPVLVCYLKDKERPVFCYSYADYELIAGELVKNLDHLITGYRAGELKEFFDNKIKDSNHFGRLIGSPVAMIPAKSVRQVTSSVRWGSDSSEPGVEVLININLKNLGFNKICDSSEAFDKISQFISSGLTQPNVEPQKQSDEVKVASHGFDQQSFRKRKRS